MIITTGVIINILGVQHLNLLWQNFQLLSLFDFYIASLQNAAISILNAFLGLWAIYTTAITKAKGFGNNIVNTLHNLIVEILNSSFKTPQFVFGKWVHTLLFFWLGINIVSLTPLSFALPTSLAFILYLVTSLMSHLYTLAFFFYGFKFFRTLIPAGISKVSYPLLVPVEVQGYWTRGVSMTSRLFANILAGHILFFLTQNATKIAASASQLPLVIPGISNYLTTGLLSLESGIGVVQGCIFAFLYAMYVCFFLKDGSQVVTFLDFLTPSEAGLLQIKSVITETK